MEVLNRKPYTVASSVWSFGIVLWEIFSNCDIPYRDFDIQQTIAKITQGSRLVCPPACPEGLHKLMLRCWDPEPNNRPIFKTIQKHIELEEHRERNSSPPS